MPPDGGMGGPSGPIARFLRAEKFDMQKAETRLRAHAAWRANYVPKGRISEVVHRSRLFVHAWPDKAQWPLQYDSGMHAGGDPE